MNNDRILVVMPTRGRPWSALEAIASVMKNATTGKVDMLVCTDTDDHHPLDISALHFWGSVDTAIEERCRFVGTINKTAEHLEPYSHVAWFGDDARMLTKGWDEIVLSHSELLVYGEDGIHNEKMATHPFVRTEIPRALGYLAPPSLVHLCCDTFLEDLAREIGSIAYDPRLKIDHLHYCVGKSENDQTYKESRAFWGQDLETYKTIKPQIPSLAQRVRDYMKKSA